MPRGEFDPDRLCLCEGVFDVLALHCLGANAIAVGGKGCGAWLQDAVSFRKVWFCSDADDGGDEAAAGWAKTLASKGCVTVRLRPPDEGKDWGDYLKGGLERLASAFVRVGGEPDWEALWATVSPEEFARLTDEHNQRSGGSE